MSVESTEGKVDLGRAVARKGVFTVYGESLDFHVLVYIEDDSWCALALEMDLRGYGDTVDLACEELGRVVYVQFMSAVELGCEEAVGFGAEVEYFEKFFSIAGKDVLQQLNEHRSEFTETKRAASAAEALGAVTFS